MRFLAALFFGFVMASPGARAGLSGDYSMGDSSSRYFCWNHIEEDAAQSTVYLTWKMDCPSMGRIPSYGHKNSTLVFKCDTANVCQATLNNIADTIAVLQTIPDGNFVIRFETTFDKDQKYVGTYKFYPLKALTNDQKQGFLALDDRTLATAASIVGIGTCRILTFNYLNAYDPGIYKGSDVIYRFKSPYPEKNSKKEEKRQEAQSAEAALMLRHFIKLDFCDP